ncbi:MAG: hypothetical protein U0996_16790 [Planctomycetaceae bacterium]
MDSSRSGLLSTLLMTLPLIVVPAIALLRPPGPIGGVSGTPADASEEDENFGIPGFEELAGSGSKSAPKKSKRAREESNDFSEIFPDEEADTTAESSDEEATSSSDDIGDAPLFDEPRKELKPSRTDTKGASRKGSMEKRKAPADDAEGSDFKEVSADDRGKSADSNDVEGTDGGETQEAAATPKSQQIIKQLNAMGAIRTLWFHAGETTPVGLAVFFRGDTELMRYRFEAVGSSRDECAKNVLDQVLAWQKARLQAE